MVCVRYKLQPMKTFAWRSWYPRVALMKLRPQVFILELQHFIFMKLRPLVFILCKHFTISFSWSSGPRFSSYARMSHLIFMNLSLMFSACARMSPFNFHEPQSHVFSPCMHFTGYFSWISGPGFQPCEYFLPSFSPIPWHLGLHLFPPLHLPEQLSRLQRAFPHICLEPMSQEKPHKTSDPKISSHTSLFWTLPEQLSKLHRGLSALNIMPAGIIHNHSFLQSHPLWPKKTKG